MIPCGECQLTPELSQEGAIYFEEGRGYCERHVPRAVKAGFGSNTPPGVVLVHPVDSIKQHSGNKYVRTIVPPPGCAPGQTDVYAVLEAFAVTCPALQHALKKLLCAGLRSKASTLQDLREARDAVTRAIQMQEAREPLGKPRANPPRNSDER